MHSHPAAFNGLTTQPGFQTVYHLIFLLFVLIIYLFGLLRGDKEIPFMNLMQHNYMKSLI